MSHPFDKHYFHGGAKVGGYAGTGYRDFPVHWNTYDRVMKRKPESVLELGCGRGYVLKRLKQYGGIPVRGLEISEHCYLTRAVDEIVTFDVTKTPWPVGDKAFDLCLSVAILEHIPENKLPGVLLEMHRTCKRGLHGIDIHDEDGFDKTHVLIRPLDFWRGQLPPGHEAVDKEDLESGPLVLPSDLGRGLKLNLGSFTNMFHGWRNLDRANLDDFARSNGYSYTCCDLDAGIPFDDGVVDLIHLSHVLEHFEHARGLALLSECRRVLKPGGLLRVAVPDLYRLTVMYAKGDLGNLRELAGDDTPGDAALFFGLLCGGDHRSAYDNCQLYDHLHAAGFGADSIRTCDFGKSASPVMERETIDLYPELSLFMEAVVG